MKRAALSLLAAFLISWAIWTPLTLLRTDDVFTAVCLAGIPLLSVLIYYGQSISQMLREQNELLRGQNPQNDAKEDGEKSKEETLQEDSSPAEPASK